MIFPACASESGAALKARLAKAIGYLASDVVVLHGDSEVDGEMSLAEMYIGAQSILSIRLRRRGTDLALASDALAPAIAPRRFTFSAAADADRPSSSNRTNP